MTPFLPWTATGIDLSFFCVPNITKHSNVSPTFVHQVYHTDPNDRPSATKIRPYLQVLVNRDDSLYMPSICFALPSPAHASRYVPKLFLLLLEKSVYTDEAYLFALVGLLLSCTDCGKALGLDAPVLEEGGATGNGVGGGGRGGARRSQPPDTVPHWHVVLLRFQVRSKRVATTPLRVIPRVITSVLWHLYARDRYPLHDSQCQLVQTTPSVVRGITPSRCGCAVNCGAW